MKTRRLPTPKLPTTLPIPITISIVIITFTVLLYAVSVISTGTFDAGILMNEPGERIKTLTSHATGLWRMIVNPIGNQTSCCSQGVNTAHPLITLILGGLFSVIPKSFSAPIAELVTASTGIISAILYYRKFRTWKWSAAAIAYVLIHPAVYEELRNPSFLFIKTIACIFLISSADDQTQEIPAGIAWFAALLFDPLLILLFIPFLLMKHWHTVAVGFGLYFLATIPYILFPIGVSYRQVIIDTIIFPSGAYTIASIGRFISFPTPLLWIPITTTFAVLSIILYRKKYPLPIIVAVWIIFTTAVSGATIPSAYLIVPTATVLLLTQNSISFTPMLFAFMIAVIMPSPILWLRLGAFGTLLTSRDIGIAAIWTAYWTLACTIGILTSVRHASDTIRHT